MGLSITLEDFIVCTLRNSIQGDAAVKHLCTFGCFADDGADLSRRNLQAKNGRKSPPDAAAANPVCGRA